MSNHNEQSPPINNLLSRDFVLLYENHAEAVYAINLQGDIIYANQAVSNLLGYSKEELMNLNIQEIVSSEGSEIFNYYFQKAVQSDTQEFITMINCKDGSQLEIKIITVSNEEDGQVSSISGTLTEIAKQQGTVSAGINKITQGLCESFIENNRDPILLLDMDAIIVLANQAFSRLLGWRKENLEGFHILSCPSIPPHLVDQMRDYYNRVVNAEPNLTTLETIRVNEEGRAHYMMLSITPIHDLNGEVCNWAVHLRDITAQKEAEQSLLRTEKILAFGQFAASVTHEISNPLISLKGFIQSIRNHKGVVYNDDHLGFMINELERIESIVTDLSILAQNQIQSNKKTDIAELLKGAIELVKPQAMLNNVQIEFEDIQAPDIWGDDQQLKMAFFNIIQNGVDAMPTGGVLRINMKPSDEYLKINVIDQGMGIAEDHIQKLGEAHYTTKEKGFGLGLTLAYKIIEQHHGKIRVQSQVEIGTQFTIELPVVSRNENRAVTA
jgi:two-component system sporulation sensor kinase A